MSKIKDYIEEHPLEVISGTAEPKENPFEVAHKSHLLYQPNCPDCWAENLVIKATPIQSPYEK